MSGRNRLAFTIWGLGLTQIVGYGSLYYSFSVLAPRIAPAFGRPIEDLFAALTLALVAGGILAPTAGRWADRFGAGRVMAVGSVAAAFALVGAALAPDGWTFLVALIAIELASALVLYTTAFAAIVQAGGDQRQIVYLTLIAGFASTVFWPLTDWLQHWVGWRDTYLVFSGMNLLLCLPVHWLIARLPWHDQTTLSARKADEPSTPPSTRDRGLFALMLAGFLTEGFVLSAVLFHLVPALADLGLGAAGIFVTTLFGPAQVLSRLVNMTFGGRLRQTVLATVAAVALPLGLIVLLPTVPSIVGACAFAVIFGLGSGLTSIVGGTLPLEVFGRAGYGARLGWIGSARLFASAFAPYAVASLFAHIGTAAGLWVVAGLGSMGITAFGLLAIRTRHYSPGAEVF